METPAHVGYMTQAFSLYNELTVRQNLQLHAELYHLPQSELSDPHPGTARSATI